MARLAAGLPATTLTGLDFHQQDSIDKFQYLMITSSCPKLAWRDESISEFTVESTAGMAWSKLMI
jgi:hypothetical protein